MSSAPTDIRYHARSRVLELCFADGSSLSVPAAWLRARLPGDGEATPAVAGEVGLARIAPVDAEHLRLYFDDGHLSAPVRLDALRALAMSYRGPATGAAPAAG